MTQPKVLLVDDERAITQSLGPFMGRSGFHVSTAADGEEALRRADDWTPVILLTHIGESTERAMALEEGDDDYLNKPFDPHELVARIRAVLRRARAGQRSLTSARRLCCGAPILDRLSCRAVLGSKELQLTPKAIALLAYLMTHPDELLTRDRLLDDVWGWDYPTGTRTVDTRIAELRRALGDDTANPRFIETVTGQGYRFVGRVEVMP